MVNIFIIVPDIQKTAEMLDYKRLGKQRVEAFQIINCLDEYDRTGNITQGWKNHPATKSWMGFTNHLKVYFNIITREWVKRGYTNNMSFYEIDETPYNIVDCGFDGKSITYDASKFNIYSFPFWVSFYPFYMSHQAALCRKNPQHYKFLLKPELNYFLNFGYFWPCNVSNQCYIDWNPSYHDKLASGAPSVYRISPLDIMTWLKSPLINPKTNRRITEKSDIYRDYTKAMEQHNIFVNNRVLYYRNAAICYIDNLDYGIQTLSAFFEQNGGIPNAAALVYEFSGKNLEIEDA